MRTAKMLLPLLGMVLCMGSIRLYAQQDDAAKEEQYRADYDRFQKMMAIKDPMKRGEEFVQFLKDRPKSQLETYVLQNYYQILQEDNAQSKWDALALQSDALLKVRPKVGEAYFFWGTALRQQNKLPEAMEALAKCYVLRCPVSDKARQFLEVLYKGTHGGKTTGLDALIEKARSAITG
ncbi:MAG: hypothetical protein ABSC02_13760 [Acidobacteriota bacterium]|jgi:tetratricopeptide (TPR) repeat protein